MNKHNCYECKYYHWYFNRCEKWDCIVNGKVHECYEPHDKICATTITSSSYVTSYLPSNATATPSSSYVISGQNVPSIGVITVSGTYGATNTKVRKKCAYCDCLNDTEYGTCKYCGAPLGCVEER